jgi:hypothetical protein
MTNDQYRKLMGMDMIRDRRDAPRPEPERKPDTRKQADEQCQGVDADLLKGIVLGCDTEGGSLD